MLNFFKKQPKRISIEDYFASCQISSQKFILKNRAKNAIKNTTNWELRLRNFLENNKNNQKLIINIAGYHHYLTNLGLKPDIAAKECLEQYID